MNPQQAYWVFVLVGGANLLPWLAYITAADYFLRIYPEVNLEYYFPVINLVVLFAGAILISQCKCEVHTIPLYLWWLLVSLSAVPLLDYFVHMPAEDGDVPPVTGFLKTFSMTITLFGLFSCAAANSILSPSLYAITAEVDSQYTQAMEVGKAVASVALIFLRGITKYACAQDMRGTAIGTLIFFLFSIMVVVVTIVLWDLLIKSPFIRDKLEASPAFNTPKRKPEHSKLTAGDQQPHLTSSGWKDGQAAEWSEGEFRIVSSINANTSNSSLSPELSAQAAPSEKTGLTQAHSTSSRGTKSYRSTVNSEYSEVDIEDGQSPPGSPVLSGTAIASLTFMEQVRMVLPFVYVPATATFVSFAVCIACFPGLTTSLKSLTFHIGDWFPLLMIFMFSSGDLIGKYLPGITDSYGDNVFIPSLRTVPILSFIHLLFVPLFIFGLSGVGVDSLARGGAGGFIHNDWIAMIALLLLGASTGYNGTYGMMLGPEQVKDPNLKEAAAKLCYFFLIGGLLFGSFVGMFIGMYVV